MQADDATSVGTPTRLATHSRPRQTLRHALLLRAPVLRIDSVRGVDRRRDGHCRGRGGDRRLHHVDFLDHAVLEDGRTPETVVGTGVTLPRRKPGDTDLYVARRAGLLADPEGNRKCDGLVEVRLGVRRPAGVPAALRRGARASRPSADHPRGLNSQRPILRPEQTTPPPRPPVLRQPARLVCRH